MTENFPLLIHSANAAGISMGIQANSSTGYDSNIYRTKNNKVGNRIQTYGAGANLTMSLSRVKFDSIYTGNYRIVSVKNYDDSEKHRLISSIGWTKNDYSRLQITGAYDINYDPRGSTKSILNVNLANAKYISRSVGSILKLPLPVRDIRLSIVGNMSEQRYENVSNRDLDNRIISVIPELSYKYSGKTSIVSGYGLSFTNYISSANSTNSDSTYNIFVGTRWNVTGKTSGHMLVGYQTSFNNENKLGNSGLSTSLSIIWSRKSYSKVFVKLDRSSKSFPSEYDNYYVSNVARVTWEHIFTKKLIIDVSSSYKYIQLRSTRGISTTDIALKLKYKLFKEIGVSTSAKYIMSGASGEYFGYYSQYYYADIYVGF